MDQVVGSVFKRFFDAQLNYKKCGAWGLVVFKVMTISKTEMNLGHN